MIPPAENEKESAAAKQHQGCMWFGNRQGLQSNPVDKRGIRDAAINSHIIHQAVKWAIKGGSVAEEKIIGIWINRPLIDGLRGERSGYGGGCVAKIESDVVGG